MPCDWGHCPDFLDTIPPHQASDMVKAYFNIQADGSFESDVMYLQLVKFSPT